MIPSEYRLEQVAATLVERLDGARRTWEDEPDRLREAFVQIAAEHAEGAASEWRELDWNADPERHAAFLRHELVQTITPRIARAAAERNATESSGFGLGPLTSPVGRVGLALATLVFAGLFGIVATRIVGPTWAWAMALVSLGLAFVPDVAGWLADRQYQAELEEIVSDAARIQEHALRYQASSAPAASAVDDPDAPRVRPPTLRDRA